MFQFVPRKVAQRTRPAPDASVPGPSSPTPSLVLTPGEAPNRGTDTKKAKGKNKATDGPTDEDIATLLLLALSDHVLWTNVELRRAVSATDDGWIPLSFLIQHSTYLLHLEQRPPDSVLVRAIRGHAEDVLEVRMRVTAPSKSAWYTQDASTSPDDGGGYEVRLKHGADALARARNSSRNEWEERTVYVENVPLAHRTVPGIHRFLSSLLPVPFPFPTPSSPPPPGTGPPPSPGRIQAITLPPHHLDRPSAPPKCKGFALVTFASAADATRLATDWPWLPRRTAVRETKTVTNNSEAAEALQQEAGAEDAVKFGFRALPKARWDALKEEYLAYRQSLLDADAEHPHVAPRRQRETRAETATPSGEEHVEPASASSPTRPSTSLARGPGPEVQTPLPPLAPSAPYPPGCLVFMRGVHPETNKTTLKALLGGHAPRLAAADALDYVDYAKGMVSCHVRVSTPTHARTLVDAFASRPLVQTHGLDGVGAGSPSSAAAGASSDSTADGTSKRITAELVDGGREALYWHKVPEKVRREAVRKAIALAQRGGEEDGGVEVASVQGAQGSGQLELELEGEDAKRLGKRPRKRRRKA